MTHPEEEIDKCVSRACPQGQAPDDKAGKAFATHGKGLISLIYKEL